jgi:acyl-CoA synthetase (NDP forming)
VVIFIPPLVTEPDAVARALADAVVGTDDKPVLGVFMRAEGAPSTLAPIPCYAFPESAAIALARVAEYAEWRRKPVTASAALLGIDRDAAKRIVSAALQRGDGWLTAPEALRLMSAIGVAMPAGCTAANAADAVAAARGLGFPVAVKALGPTLLHKTEHKAVVLDVKDAGGIRAAWADFAARFGPGLTGMLVQRMVPDGVEMLVGATADPVFGPLLVCGSGGILVDLIGDSAVRLHPVTQADAHEMIDELKAARLLRGYRGAPPADEHALCDVIVRVSALLDMCPEIVELDINPVRVFPSGVSAVDVRVRVEHERPRPRTRRIEY